jgi:hypothetical protein
MAAILGFFTGYYEEDVVDDKDKTIKDVKGVDVTTTLTSLCSINNCGIPPNDKLVYGNEGAEIRKESSNKRDYNGNVGRVYLLDHSLENNGYTVGWVLNDAFSDCMICAEPFEFLSRARHHCRGCGCLVCDECSQQRAKISQLSRGKLSCRVCDVCAAKNPPDDIWDLHKN